MKRKTWICLVALSLAVGSESRAADIGTAFTYQGRLEKPAGTPVTNTCDFRFGLWDAAAGGGLVPPGAPAANPMTVSAVAVSDGVFTATMDFGHDAIDGGVRIRITF